MKTKLVKFIRVDKRTRPRAIINHSIERVSCDHCGRQALYFMIGDYYFHIAVTYDTIIKADRCWICGAIGGVQGTTELIEKNLVSVLRRI